MLSESEISLDCLAQKIADVIGNAVAEGMDVAHALAVVGIVAVDVGRAQFGEDFVDTLADAMKLRRGQPLPATPSFDS